MSRIQSLQTLFKRYRRPGDLVVAIVFLVFSVFLLSQIYDQTAYRAGGKLFTQPRFWPAVSLIGMVVFAALHLTGSLLSERLDGRWKEVGLWVASVEYALWFVAYAAVVPFAGYLPTTVIFAVALAFRAGYRSRGALFSAGLAAVVIVILFKSLLQVKLPGGRIYEALPDGLRSFMLTYF